MFDLFQKIDDVLKQLSVRVPLTMAPYQLDDVRDAIIARSNIDRIEFISFDDTRKIGDAGRGEIEGKVEVYEMHEAPYAPLVTKADIYYLGTLNTCWKRFVVVKEMCQLLWFGQPQMRIQNEEQLIALVEALTLPQTAKDLLPDGPLTSERWAVLAALEILCPFDIRAALLKPYEAKTLTALEIADMFKIPEAYTAAIFDHRYHDVIERYRQADAQAKLVSKQLAAAPAKRKG